MLREYAMSVDNLDPVFTDNSTVFLHGENITSDDASWILTNAFLILTMQSGFALLECGCVSSKNVANIMIKNTVDVTVGGMSYWMFGYGLSYGRPATPFFGMGNFFLHHTQTDGMGTLYAEYIFQFSFATTATTIVSGAVAERMKLSAYIAFSFLNTFLYALPANWIWNEIGFLKSLGFLDFAGGCVIHFSGGVAALVATTFLGPRLGRFTDNEKFCMSSPVTALTGTFMLWWAWLGFNCGSTFGIRGNLWKKAALAGINTLNGSIAGGVTGFLLSLILRKGYYDIGMLINAILGGLVSVTGICGYTTPYESLFIGFVGALFSVGMVPVVEWLKIDDPVGVIPVHFVCSAWGVISIGLFAQKDTITSSNRYDGLFHGGGVYLLGVQVLGLLCVGTWICITVWLLFFILDRSMKGIRLSPDEEILGADWVEHRVRSEHMVHKLEKAISMVSKDNEHPEDVLARIFAELLKTTTDVSARIIHINPRESGENVVDNLSDKILEDNVKTIDYVNGVGTQLRFSFSKSKGRMMSIPTDSLKSRFSSASKMSRPITSSSMSSISSIKSGQVGFYSENTLVELGTEDGDVLETRRKLGRTETVLNIENLPNVPDNIEDDEDVDSID